MHAHMCYVWVLACWVMLDANIWLLHTLGHADDDPSEFEGLHLLL